MSTLSKWKVTTCYQWTIYARIVYIKLNLGTFQSKFCMCISPHRVKSRFCCVSRGKRTYKDPVWIILGDPDVDSKGHVRYCSRPNVCRRWSWEGHRLQPTLASWGNRKHGLVDAEWVRWKLLKGIYSKFTSPVKWPCELGDYIIFTTYLLFWGYLFALLRSYHLDSLYKNDERYQVLLLFLWAFCSKHYVHPTEWLFEKLSG